MQPKEWWNRIKEWIAIALTVFGLFGWWVAIAALFSWLRNSWNPSGLEITVLTALRLALSILGLVIWWRVWFWLKSRRPESGLAEDIAPPRDFSMISLGPSAKKFIGRQRSIHAAERLLTDLVSGEFPKTQVRREQKADRPDARKSSPRGEASDVHPVDCTVFAPDRVQRKQRAILQVFLHRPEDRRQAEGDARRFDRTTAERGHRSLVMNAAAGTVFAFDLEIEGFVVEQRLDTLVWNGRPQAVTFLFTVPKRTKWGQHVGTLWISMNGAPVGRICFQIEVVRDASGARERPTGEEARHYRACFCSYSSLDRVEMLKRAQGLQAAGLEMFIDVLKLRPGDVWNPKIFAAIDECDLFVVIWSKNARHSRWVRKESRYALKRQKQHGRPDFRPIPVEGPPIASVPRTLRRFHFNDELLSLIRAAELEAQEARDVYTDFARHVNISPPGS